jgi:prefoldin subunit 5
MPYDVPFAPTASRSQELDGLKDQAKYFEEALDEIKDRIGELEKTETEV